MNRYSRLFLTGFFCGLAGLTLFFAAACKLGPSKAREERATKVPSAASQQAGDPGIDLNCVIDHIQNPPEAFHYTYKKDTPDNNLVQEADLTPDTIDGTSKDKYASSTIKGVKSDRTSWQSAWMGLAGISGMSSTIALIHSGSPTVREGAEKSRGLSYWPVTFVSVSYGATAPCPPAKRSGWMPARCTVRTTEMSAGFGLSGSGAPGDHTSVTKPSFASGT